MIYAESEMYIPSIVYAGMNNDHVAFMTFKTLNGKWQNLHIFERFCKFKPNVQRDDEKELKKAIYNAVEHFENVPISGFRVVDFCNDYYNLSSKSLADPGMNEVLLQDPRGWKVAMRQSEFNRILKLNGMNLKDGVVEGISFVYAWPTVGTSSDTFKLISADTTLYEEIKQRSIELEGRADESKRAFAKAKDFIYGHVYSTSGNQNLDEGLYIYLGKHDTYSELAHRTALHTRHYDLDELIKDRYDITSKDCHIFYSVDDHRDPYISRRSVDKLFIDVGDIGGFEFTSKSKFKSIYNDQTKPLTLENIEEDMKHSLYFNKIDLTKEYDVEAEDLDFDIFDSLYTHEDDKSCRIANKRSFNIWPFYEYDHVVVSPRIYNEGTYTPSVFRSSFGHNLNRGKYYPYVKITKFGQHSGNRCDIRETSPKSNLSRYDEGNIIHTIHNAVNNEAIYCVLEPKVPSIWLENGYKVPQYIATFLLPEYETRR